MSEQKKKFYLPTILLGVLVAAVFLVAIFTYQVEESEQALVLTVGTPTSVEGPGLHFRWPLPIQEIIKYDVRTRKFSGKTGRLEETSTKDKRQIVVSICVFYKVSDVKKYKMANGPSQLEDYLSNQMSNAKTSVVGRHTYEQILDVKEGEKHLAQMKSEILEILHENLLENYGVDVFQVDFTYIGVPEKTAEAIAGTMRQNRETLAARAREKGKAEAQIIRNKAETQKENALTDARAEAKKMKTEGTAKAIAYYKEASKAPELAAFLQKLEALKSTFATPTTLILHTGNPPFDVFDFKTLEIPAGKDKVQNNQTVK